MGPDVTTVNHGSVAFVEPRTQRAKDWIAEHVTGEQTWWCGGLVVEPRYLEDLTAGMRDAGLTVE